MSKKLTIQAMQQLAESHGGKCLSDTYLGVDSKLTWQCAKGHKWMAIPYNVRRGTWCRICANVRTGEGQRLSIGEMRDIARSHGGKCLSTSYQDNASKLRWECSQGHTWLARPSNVKEGHWCPECAGVTKHEIKDAQQLARGRGGECLSGQYDSRHRRLKWRCTEWHTWMASYSSVDRGSWCPECAAGLGERICRAHFEQMFGRDFPKARPDWLINSDGYQMELDGYCEDLALAFEHQGRQHHTVSHFFRFSEDDFLKRRTDDRRKRTLCRRHGVTLIEIPEILHTLPLAGIQQHIIEQCAAQGVALPETAASVTVKLLKAYTPDARERMEAIHKTVSMRGGTCLSPAYLGSQTPLRFRCSKGHDWEATPQKIISRTWCPVCAWSKGGFAKRLGLPAMQALAASRGGRCLSDGYINTSTHLLWECKAGHQWKAAPSGIKSGHWCPFCRKLTIEEMQALAQSRGGKCLSDHYANSRAKLIWECSQGHKWEATPGNIEQGRWCPFCAGVARKTLEKMQEIATARGGRCLSSVYGDGKTMLRWECAQAHQWEASPRHVVSGGWCPYCAGRRKTIEDMRHLAAQRGGECLSPTYLGAHTHLMWQCAQGHKWMAQPSNIQRGIWCPVCGHRRGGRRRKAP